MNENNLPIWVSLIIILFTIIFVVQNGKIFI